MKIRRVKGHRQGKSPKLSKGKKYQQVLESLFIEGATMAGADALGVGKIFHEAGIDAVVIGGLVVGCHSGRPRSTQDIDVVVNAKSLPKKVIAQLARLVGSKKVERHPSFVSFIKKTLLGDREVLDVRTSRSGSYGLVFDNSIALVIAGSQIRIPTAEMMVVLKYTAAVNPIRQKAKQVQDWADVYAIVDANDGLSMSTVRHLADSVVPGWGEDLGNKITFHRT